MKFDDFFNALFSNPKDKKHDFEGIVSDFSSSNTYF